MNKFMTQLQRMTETPVPKLIISLSIPTIISMLVTNIYNLVDTAFVGTLGNSASGAVGIVFGFMAILQAIGFMFGQGSGSIISRKLGAQDSEGASIVASTGFITAFAVSIVTEIICFIFLDSLVMGLGSTTTIAPYAKTYISFILLAAPFTVTSFTLNNILRYEGKASLGMIGLLIGAVLNICGDAILMFGLHLGIAGAGISTAVSQIISFSILFSMFLRGKTTSRISLRYYRLQHVVLEIATTGFPSMLRQGLNSFTTVLLNSEASVYGDPAVAAMSIVSRITFFTVSIAIGIGQGFQPVSGFNYGAGRFDRVKKGYFFTIMLSECILVILGLIVFIFSGDLISIFRNNETVIEIGTRALQLQCLIQVVMPICMTTEMLFQSTGNKLFATILSATRNGLLFIPTLLILARIRGLAGIQEAQPLASLLSVIPTLFFAFWFFKKQLAE